MIGNVFHDDADYLQICNVVGLAERFRSALDIRRHDAHRQPFSKAQTEHPLQIEISTFSCRERLD